MEKYEKEKLWKAVNSLPEKQRRRIILRFYYGLKISQISKIEECDERRINSTLSKALQNLRMQIIEKMKKIQFFFEKRRPFLYFLHSNIYIAFC